MDEENKLDVNSFKPNSHIYRQEKQKEKHLKKVISGKVETRTTESLGRKIVKLFFTSDIDDLKSYAIEDLIIPKIKETVWELFDAWWMGGSRNRNKSANNYNKMYKITNQSQTKTVPAERTKARNFRELYFDTRADAEAALDALLAIVDSDYKCASISDYYEIIGITGDFTDNKYGWTDLSNAKVKRALGGGYLLELPPAILLD